MDLETLNNNKKIRFFVGVLQVLAVLWMIALTAYFGAISGASNGSGLFGTPPSKDDESAYAVAILLCLTLFVATIFSWKRKTFTRIGISGITIVAFQVIVFGIYG